MTISKNNIFCEFISEDNQTFVCKKCGTSLYSETPQHMPPVFICSYPLVEDNQKDIGYAQKIKNFAGSLIDHIKTGAKLCTDEQIEKRFSICESCEFYKDKTCTQCGCPLIRNRKFISKLAWAEQECPVGKWKKEI